MIRKFFKLKKCVFWVKTQFIFCQFLSIFQFTCAYSTWILQIILRNYLNISFLRISLDFHWIGNCFAPIGNIDDFCIKVSTISSWKTRVFNLINVCANIFTTNEFMPIIYRWLSTIIYHSMQSYPLRCKKKYQYLSQ